MRCYSIVPGHSCVVIQDIFEPVNRRERYEMGTEYDHVRLHSVHYVFYDGYDGFFHRPWAAHLFHASKVHGITSGTSTGHKGLME